MIRPLGRVVCQQILPDEKAQITATLLDWADNQQLGLILTTGGTGLSPRDLTPQATEAVLDYQIPGMAEAMRAASLRKTPHAMLSRALAGVRGKTLILNLPGSPKAVRENLAAVLPALPHAVAKLQGDMSDCATR
jgi:molybdenum cofactor synthesis domain-containing protein